MVACGTLIQPLLNLIHDRIMEQPVLHMDETRVQVLNEPGRTTQSMSYMWVLRAEEKPAVLFHYAPSRGGDEAKHLLMGYGSALMVDGYEGYSAVCNQQAITRLGCWAHARRKFMEAKKAQDKHKTDKSDPPSYIQQLYGVEKVAKDQRAEDRLSLRQTQAQAIMDKLHQWLEKSLAQVPPKTLLGKTLYYLNHQWPHLIRHLDDGRYPMGRVEVWRGGDKRPLLARRSVSTPRSSNRTCRFPASGSLSGHHQAFAFSRWRGLMANGRGPVFHTGTHSGIGGNPFRFCHSAVVTRSAADAQCNLG